MDYEAEYKIVEPFGRGHWVICESQEDTKFHLRNIADNLPDKRLEVNVYDGNHAVAHDKGSARDIYQRLFNEAL